MHKKEISFENEVMGEKNITFKNEVIGYMDATAQNSKQAQPAHANLLLTVAVEILSPSNPTHDLIRKLRLYETHEIPEYWIVDAADQIIIRNTLKNGRYLPDYFESCLFESAQLPGFGFDVGEFFSEG